MRSTLLLLFAVVLGTEATAQSVAVRSGQHEDFVRLIVDLPGRMKTTVENSRTEAEIRFENKSLTFNTADVFRRISGDQVLDVVSGDTPGTLVVKFGCDCEVTSFWHGASLLVLDVVERKTPLVEVNVISESADLIDVGDSFTPSGRVINLKRETGSLAATLAKPQLKPDFEPTIATQEEFSEEEDVRSPQEQRILEEARNQLALQVGRAASQGLLSPNSSLRSLQSSEKENDPEPAQNEENPRKHENLNIQAQSSIDRDFKSVLQGSINLNSQTACFEDREIDVGAWGSDATFGEQIGKLRKQLIGEFDRLNTDAVRNLARVYLHFGFGLEARETLSMLEEPSENSELLEAIADIMEVGHSLNPTPLQTHLNCEGPVALWSVLSHNKLPRDMPINTNSVLLAFDALPKHLRSHLGPILSRRFLEAGDKASAEAVLRILNRSHETSGPNADFVDAEISLTEGEYSEAVSEMEAVAEANAEISAEALVRMIETAVQNNQAVSYQNALLAGAYLQQYRDSPLEPDLIKAFLVGLAASGAFDESFKERKRFWDNLSEESRAFVDNHVVAQLVEKADDIQFLKHVLSSPPNQIELVPQKTGNDVAARLSLLGFPSEARKFIEYEAAGNSAHERQVLRAKISLQENKPRRALAELLNVAGPEADAVRAQASSLSGDHQEAAEIFADSGMAEEAIRQSWLAEDWDRLLSSDDATYANSAALAALRREENTETVGLPDEPELSGALTQNRSLLQQSTSARNLVEELLSASPSPDLGDPDL